MALRSCRRRAFGYYGPTSSATADRVALMKVELSRDELRVIEEACRTLARRYWSQSDEEPTDSVKQAIVDAAIEAERLAERFGMLTGSFVGRRA